MAIDLLTNFSTALTKTTAVTGVSGASSATISCWYYATSVAGGFDPVLRLAGAGATDTMCQLYTFSDSSFNWSSDDGTFENAVRQTVVLNQWHHYALVYTQTGITAYYDGVSIGSASHTFGSRASQIQIVLGPCQGYVQDAVVYSAALTAVEVAALFGKRTPSRTTNLLGWYPCFADSRTKDYGPNKWDLSETGTITGAPVDAPAAWSGPGRLNVLRQATTTLIDGTGASSVSASGTLSVATALVGSGQVSVSASGTLNTGALTGTGQVSVSGSGALSATAALTGAGNSSVSASGTVGQGRAVDGTGASLVSATGTVSRQLQLVGSGDCAVAGSAAVSVAYALTGTGQVSVSGAASFAGAPGATGTDEQPVDRRWIATLGSRRRVRR